MTKPIPTCHDIHGRPIRRGDLLRTFHFRDGRRNRWLYHVACQRDDGYLEAVPFHYFDRDRRKLNGGSYNLLPSIVAGMGVEIIADDGSGEDFFRRQKATPEGGAAAER